MGTSRQLAVIMFTDMVGFSALMSEDENQALDLLKQNKEIHDSLLQKFDGSLLKEMGDGMLLSFNNATDAVKYAATLQHITGLQDYQLRIGIHLGEVIFDSGDVYGEGVNIASRLEPLARPGEVVVSEDVSHNLQNKTGIQTEYFDEVPLKNISGKWKLFKVDVDDEVIKELIASPLTKVTGETIQPSSWIPQIVKWMAIGFIGVGLGVGLWMSIGSGGSQGPGGRQMSIAVLPFDNQGADEDAYFAMGISEDILTHLGKIKELTVMSRVLLREYNHQGKTPAEIGEELKVAYLLSGNVRRSGGNLRIGCQLVSTRDESETWSEIYDREGGDVFQIQSDIASKVANSLEAELSDVEKMRTSLIPTDNLTAYNLYLKGKDEYDKFIRESNENAITYFRKAIAEDEGLANAWAGLSDAYVQSITVHGTRPRSMADSALYFSQRAVDIDPESADTWKALAYVLTVNQQHDEAKKAYYKALDINPNHGASLNNLATLLMGEDPVQAVSLLKRLITIDPLSWFPYSNLAIIYSAAGLYTLANDYNQSALTLDPTNPGRFVRQAIIEASMGTLDSFPVYVNRILSIDSTSSRSLEYAGLLAIAYDENLALQCFEKAIDADDFTYRSRWFVPLGIGYLYLKEGLNDKGSKILDDHLVYLKSEYNNGFRPHWAGLISDNYAARGMYDEAIEWRSKLDRGANPDEYSFFSFTRELRKDPRYEKLVEKGAKERKRIQEELLALEEKG